MILMTKSAVQVPSLAPVGEIEATPASILEDEDDDEHEHENDKVRQFSQRPHPEVWIFLAWE